MIDDVPTVTLEALEAARQARLAEIERLAAGIPYRKGNYGNCGRYRSPCTLVRLSDGRIFRFTSITQACAFAGVQRPNVCDRIHKGKNEYRGYRWLAAEYNRKVTT